MIETIIELDNKVDISEFKKVVCFISEDIIKYDISGNILKLSYKDNIDVENLNTEIIKIANKYIKSDKEEKVIYKQEYERNYFKDIVNNEDVFHVFENGLIGLKDISVFLFNCFENYFTEIALAENAIIKKYPVLLPMDAYKKTGYLRNSPQYAIFCCAAHENMSMLENMNEVVDDERIIEHINLPKHALSPAACFHTYLEYEGQRLDGNIVVTFTQNVFRNEGRLNYTDVGRLRDYHVTEIVLIGNEQFVEEKRKSILNSTIRLINDLKLNSYVCIASDPFVLPKMQKYRKMQKMAESKYELKINYDENETMSCASFNLHGTAFTYPFDIMVEDNEDTVTGCVGFGIERWVIAFLCQYGTIIDNWPERIRNQFKEETC